MPRTTTRVLLAATLSALLLASAAQAAPTIAITSPAEGTSVSRSDETMVVTGTAAFDAPIASNRTYFLRRDVCGVAGIRQLSVVAGAETIGCGGATAIATPIVDNYTAIDGVPILVDPAKLTAKLTIVTGAFLAGVGGGTGNETIAVTLRGTTADGSTVTLGTGTKTTLITPNQDEVTNVIDFAVTAVPDVLTGLAMETRISGTVARSYVSYAGASKLELSILDPGAVQVSSDSATFSASKTVYAALAADGTWIADVAIPATGQRKIYARAVQGALKSASAIVGITVVP